MPQTLKVSIGLLAVATVASNADADLIRFDNANPGQAEYFDWAASPWLDITAGAQQQTGFDDGTSSFMQVVGSDHGVIMGNAGSTELEVDGFLLSPVPDGLLVPSGSEFDELGFISYFDGQSLLEDGQLGILGVRFMLSDWHYGWIGVAREGNELEAIAWAYETQPNVPVAPWQFPEPSTLSFATIVAMVVFKRRTGLR